MFSIVLDLSQKVKISDVDIKFVVSELVPPMYVSLIVLMSASKYNYKYLHNKERNHRFVLLSDPTLEKSFPTNLIKS